MIHEQIIADIIAEIEAARVYQEGICHRQDTANRAEYADAKAAMHAYAHVLRIIKQKLSWTERNV